MPARNGQQYIQGLKERPPSLYMKGEKVKDPTTHPGLSNGVKTLGRLYDLQHDPRAGGGDDLHFAIQWGPGRTVLHYPEERGGPGSPPQDDAPLGAGQLRNDGRSPDFLQCQSDGDGRGRRLFGEDRRSSSRTSVTTMRRCARRTWSDPYPRQPATQPGAHRDRHPRPRSGLQDNTTSPCRGQGNGCRASWCMERGCWPPCPLPTRSRSTRQGRTACRPGRRDGRRSPFAIPCDAPGLKFLCRESMESWPFPLRPSPGFPFRGDGRTGVL